MRVSVFLSPSMGKENTKEGLGDISENRGRVGSRIPPQGGDEDKLAITQGTPGNGQPIDSPTVKSGLGLTAV